ncbi:uncharacterized protein DUF3822 [Arcticibacter tournemirensis]|uniref:DUF3822 family protein n=1 Tax=Arcticibacter tournemirensis TaxID=699437 RepID=A0A5M9GLG1_9SPHI|nr:DUF3822 family protein [Arcticibacter tournemirensis]KAA8475180.1 DUF3822 family protein [Arcticibacter tournemirensis]TQM52431.1 uncharacterized protein DUF3822 [Arcticibacter tournemirensis]
MNNNGALHLKVGDFSTGQAENCELLIRIGAGRLSFAIIDTKENLLKVLFDSVLFSSIAETFNDLFNQNEYLGYAFQKVKIATETFNFTFIPSELYSDNSLPVYQNFINSTGQVRHVIKDLKGAKIKTVASIEEAFIAPLLAKFPQAAIYTQPEPLIEGSLKDRSGNKTLVLQFNSGTFEALVISSNDIIFYNIFSSPTTDDFNYYLLLIMQQLELKPSDIAVRLMGEIEKYSENYRRVSKYFNNITFADSTKLFNYPEAFKLAPSHQFFSLLSLSLCE